MSNQPVTVSVLNFRSGNIHIITFVPDDFASTDLGDMEEPLSNLLEHEYGIYIKDCEWMQMTSNYSIRHGDFTCKNSINES